jgi:hypothetical protein
LRRHEAKVREQLPIAPAVERVLTADANVFQSLRRLVEGIRADRTMCDPLHAGLGLARGLDHFASTSA